MSFSEHGSIELAPTTTKGTGPFVVVFDSGTRLSRSVTTARQIGAQMLQVETNGTTTKVPVPFVAVFDKKKPPR